MVVAIAVLLFGVTVTVALMCWEAVVHASAQISVEVLAWASERARSHVARLDDEIGPVDRELSDLTESDTRLTKEREAHERCIRERENREADHVVASDRFRQLRKLHATERLRNDPLTLASMRSHVEPLLRRKNAFAPWARLVVGERVAPPSCTAHPVI